MWKTDPETLAKYFVPNMQCLGISAVNRATPGARRREKGKIDASITYVQEWHKSPDLIRDNLHTWRILFEEDAWDELVLEAVKLSPSSALVKKKNDDNFMHIIPERLSPETLGIIEDTVAACMESGKGIREQIREEIRVRGSFINSSSLKPTYVPAARTIRKTAATAGAKTSSSSLPRNAPVESRRKHIEKQIAELNERIRGGRPPKKKPLIKQVTSKVKPAPSPMSHKRTPAALRDELSYKEEAVAAAAAARVKRAKKQSAEAAPGQE